MGSLKILTERMNVLQESATSFSTLHRLVLEFKRGRTNVENKPHSGRTKSTTIPEIIEQVQNIVSEDPSLD